MTNTTQTAPPHYQVLDPSLLGRPVHLLPVFAAQLREDLAQAMRLPMNRRYWGGFQVEDVAFSRLEGSEPRSRWLSYASPAGHILFSLERRVLLSVLNYRYGRSKSDTTAVDESQVKVTATEERLAVVLGQQLAGTLAGRIELNLPASDKAPGQEPDEFEWSPGNHPPKGTWVISVTLADVASGSPGVFWFALDKHLMTGVLHGLLRERDQGRKVAGADQTPLAQRLQVSLNGRLISKEVPLGSLFELRVGDVIPISLHRADVLLEDSRLFTAAVTEHKGKLCLTSFEDAE
jgi:flagellar motor switch protein FliM